MRPVPPRPLVPRVRRRVGLVAALAATGVAVLGAHVAGGSRPTAADAAVASALDLRSGTPAVVGQALADLGGAVPVTVALLVLAVLAHRGHGWRAVGVLVGPAVATAVTSLVGKPVVGRVHHGVLAYPSGHTTAFASVAVVAVVLLAARPGVSGRLLLAAGTGAALLVVAVGLALVGRGYHYATDTLGGAGVAVAVVPAVALLVDTVTERRAGRRAHTDAPTRSSASSATS